MNRILLTAVAGLLLTNAAHATDARMTALSNNAGFIDDTDIFLYPSVLADLPAQATLNYDAGAFDGGFALDDGRMLWFQRHEPTGAEEGFRVLYGKAEGETGYQIRAAQSDGTFSVGGAWSNGPGRGSPQNLAIDGDVRLINQITGDDLKFGLNAAITGRNLQPNKLTLWTAGIDVDTNVETATLFGAYTFGPRFSTDTARLALQVGPALNVVAGIGDNNADPTIAITIPYANFAGEYQLREWFRLRGSVTSSWTGMTDTSDALDNLVWGNVVGGSLGVGFSHDIAQFDMSINPAWALGGPYLLSGAANPMFGVLSARVRL
ncbi:MAG: hypothetical protein ACI8S6_001090 [Myxococcota bacterium]|jgi:hypothetical protein